MSAEQPPKNETKGEGEPKPKSKPEHAVTSAKAAEEKLKKDKEESSKMAAAVKENLKRAGKTVGVFAGGYVAADAGLLTTAAISGGVGLATGNKTAMNVAATTGKWGALMAKPLALVAAPIELFFALTKGVPWLLDKATEYITGQKPREASKSSSSGGGHGGGGGGGHH